MVIKTVEIYDAETEKLITVLFPNELLTAEKRNNMPDSVRLALSNTHFLVNPNQLNVLSPDLESEVTRSTSDQILSPRRRRNSINVQENDTLLLYKNGIPAARILIIGNQPQL